MTADAMRVNEFCVDAIFLKRGCIHPTEHLHSIMKMYIM